MPIDAPPHYSAQELFLKAQAAWSVRATPPYESFVLPCASTLLADRCAPGADVQFIVRLSDGRTYAQTLAARGAPPAALMRGGYIAGPAGAPLGFYRRVPAPGTPATAPPPNLAADPLATIATVSAADVAYRIRTVGAETIAGATTDHLVLEPLRDPDLYPLRDLWIERGTFAVMRLVYAQPFGSTTARITYDFGLAGTPPVWSIVHISGSTRRESVSEDLQHISFPAVEPESLFQP